MRIFNSFTVINKITKDFELEKYNYEKENKKQENSDDEILDQTPSKIAIKIQMIDSNENIP